MQDENDYLKLEDIEYINKEYILEQHEKTLEKCTKIKEWLVNYLSDHKNIGKKMGNFICDTVEKVEATFLPVESLDHKHN